MYLYNFRSFLMIPLIVFSAHAQNFVTNGAGSLVLNNTNFVGTSTQPAGDIRNFDFFDTVNVTYEGYVNSASATDASGGLVYVLMITRPILLITHLHLQVVFGSQATQQVQVSQLYWLREVLVCKLIMSISLANFWRTWKSRNRYCNAVIQGGGGGSVQAQMVIQ